MKTGQRHVQLLGPTGQSYVAKLDGTETPIKSNPGDMVVPVRRIDANTLEEIEVVHYSVVDDGKSMTIAFTDNDGAIHGSQLAA